VDASGGTARQLTNWPGSETEAVWSGDGANIYFVSYRDAKFGDIWRTSSRPAARTTHYI
jgi:Tol biopolymer transport system component